MDFYSRFLDLDLQKKLKYKFCTLEMLRTKQLNNFSEKNRLILPKTTVDDKTLLYWQSFKKGKYIRETKTFEEIPVAKCQPGDQMDLNLGYKAIFKEN